MDDHSFDEILTAAPVAMVVLDRQARCVHSSDRFAALLDADPRGDGWVSTMSGDDRSLVVGAVGRAVTSGEPTTARCQVAPDQWIELEIAPRVGPDGRAVGAIAVATVDLDAPLLHSLDERTDPLTGAANREGVLSYLAALLASPPDPHDRPTSVGVLAIDVEGMVEVRERLGAIAAEELLGAVVGRLRGAVRFCDLVGRLDEDRFVIVADQDDDPSAAEHVAERVLTLFARPFRLDRATVRIAASIGLYVGDRTQSAEEILGEAGRGALAAKTAGGGTWRRVDTLRIVR